MMNTYPEIHTPIVSTFNNSLTYTSCTTYRFMLTTHYSLIEFQLEVYQIHVKDYLFIISLILISCESV